MEEKLGLRLLRPHQRVRITRNIYVGICFKLQEWVPRKQMMVFTCNVLVFKNATSNIKGKRDNKRYA